MTEQPSKSAPELSLKDVVASIKAAIAYLFKKWFIIVGCAILGGALGIVYAWSQKPKYVAVLTFSMEDGKSDGGGLASLASQFGFSLGNVGGIFSGENILILIQSDKIIQSTLLSQVTVDNKTQSLLNFYLEAQKKAGDAKEPKDPAVKNVSFPEGQKPETYTRLQDSVLHNIVQGVKKEILKAEKPENKFNLYKVTCTSKNEDFSLLFCKQLIQQVSDFYVTIKTKRSTQIVNILQSRTDSIKRAYDRALFGRAELSDANINPAFSLPTVGVQREQTNITVLATAYTELLKNLEVAKFNLLKDTPLIQVIDEPEAPLVKKKLGRLLSGIIGAFLFGFTTCVILLVRKIKL